MPPSAQSPSPPTPSPRTPVVTYLGRAGCHLCDVAHEVVLGVRAELGFELVELDVDDDPEWRAEYGDSVPVVLVDGELHSYFEVDRARLMAALADPDRPASGGSPT